MTVRKKKLGRGLDALLGSAAKPVPPTGEAALVAGGEVIRELPVEHCQRGRYQPRRDFEPRALQELADSIRRQGVMQPIVVRPLGTERFEIIAGERRWRASQLAERATIPAVVRDISDEAAIAMALIENIQRENLNPVEEAQALRRLQTEFALTQNEVAAAVGKSRPVIANLLRLLTLEGDVLELLEAGAIDTGHAKVLLALEGAAQVAAARTVVKGGLSVRQTEALIRRDTKPAAGSQAARDPNVAGLERDLAERLGAAVAISHGAGGGGKLVISYTSLDELDGILSKIK